MEVIKYYGFEEIRAKEWFRYSANDDLDNLQVDRFKALLKISDKNEEA